MNYYTRKMVKGEDLNGAKNFFGGRAMEWIDEEAAIFAICQLKSENLVTKAISAIEFKAPAKSGDIIEIGCDVVKFGRTSITVKVSMRNKTTKQEIVTVDAITFVNLDENGLPAAHGVNERSE